jgi:hypothetical protein
MIRVVNLSNSAFDPPIYSAFCAFPRNNHSQTKNKDRFVADWREAILLLPGIRED